MTPPLGPSGLHSVHPGNHPSTRLYFLDAENRKPEIQAAKRRCLDRLALRPGGRVLDVGCGPGDDARALAAIVGASGRVVGIDVDPMMLQEAERRSAGQPKQVEFRLGDIYDLKEPDAAFDACRAERVFLHLEEPARALAEMIRVLEPGGRLSVIDRDIETRTIDAPDRATTRAILNVWCDGFRGGWIGRALPRLFREAGLLDIVVESTTVIDTDYDAYMAQYDLARVAAYAQRAGAINADAGERWLASLGDCARRGSFFASMTWFIVSGRKPPTT